MYKVNKAEFMLCAAWKSQWPEASVPEICLAVVMLENQVLSIRSHLAVIWPKSQISRGKQGH